MDLCDWIKEWKADAEVAAFANVTLKYRAGRSKVAAGLVSIRTKTERNTLLFSVKLAVWTQMTIKMRWFTLCSLGWSRVRIGEGFVCYCNVTDGAIHVMSGLFNKHVYVHHRRGGMSRPPAFTKSFSRWRARAQLDLMLRSRPRAFLSFVCKPMVA